jgi:hypothetical protein
MRATALVVCCALFAAAPACAMRAHDFIDADQRTDVTLPGDLTTLILPAQHTGIPAASDEYLQPAPEQPHVTPRPITSPVPEPSGWMLLACGLLMLSLTRYRRAEARFAIGNNNQLSTQRR